MKSNRVEIVCSHCGADTLLRREPVYEGLVKTGEVLSCPACGHVFAAGEEVPYKRLPEGPRVFNADELPEPVRVFEETGARPFCRYCADYVVNPFMQYCSRHRREVEATGTCPHFSPVGSKPSSSIL